MRTSVRTGSSDGSEVVSVHVSFDEAALSLTPTALGIVVRLAGCATAGEPGSPGLPSRVLRVALPLAARATEVTARADKTLLVTGKDALIAPVQPPRPAVHSSSPSGSDPLGAIGAIEARFRSSRTNTLDRSALRRPDPPAVPALGRPVFAPARPALYESELRQPRPLARLLGTEEIGDVPVALIEINPVRLGADSQLEFHPELTVTIRCTAQPARRVLRRSPNQARRTAALARRMVINPEQLPGPTGLSAAAPAEVDYLVITDDQTWDAAGIRPVSHAGDLKAHFAQLVAWKSQRGLAARLVTVTDIVSGTYGEFREGARDLQEVLRNFLKWAVRTWGVSWVLLGGDVDIIPVRRVAGGVLGHIYVGASDPPADNSAYYTGRFLKMNVVYPGDWWPGPSTSHLLVRPDTGQLIPYDTEGTSGPERCGWYFTTDDTYEHRSRGATQFVRVNGSEKEINATLQWLYEWNTLPTDLYYASLTGPGSDVPGRHDWDLVDNGIYGQHNWQEDLDGIAYRTDVSVGRAPVASPTEAAAFTAKVIAYEQFRSPSGEPLDPDWPRRMLLVSANFWRTAWIFPDASDPPGQGMYFHDKGSEHTLIRLSEMPRDLLWNLIAALSDSEVRLVPFDLDAATNGHGWYFARSATDLSPSEESLKLGKGIRRRVPVPTEWVVVYAKPDELAPEHYVFDRATQDTSMEGKEAVRSELATNSPRIDLITRLYEDEFDLTPEQAAAAPVEHATAERVRTALDAAPHFVSLSGHGSYDGCCWLNSGIAQALSNGFTSFIGYADSCFTNQFDTEDAVSEHLLYNPKGGAVAYIGSTRFSWIGVGDDFELAFFRGLPSTCNLGLLADSRCAQVNGPSGWGVYNKWVALSLNLVGDPEMPLWIGPPRTLHVSYDAAPRKGRPFTVRVTERLPLGPLRALPDAYVHIQQRGFAQRALTDSNGEVTLSLNGASPGEITITVSHEGFIPFIGKESVTESVWVSGLVEAILHQHGGPDRTLIRLRLHDQGGTTERSYLAQRSLPDYELIVGAAISAHLAGKTILLCVDSPESGATIERFRIGTWNTPLAEIAEP